MLSEFGYFFSYITKQLHTIFFFFIKKKNPYFLSKTSAVGNSGPTLVYKIVVRIEVAVAAVD